MKLYIVLDASLPAGPKMAQACHALTAFQQAYPHIYEYWHKEANNICILQSERLDELAADLEARGVRISRFVEPDYGDALSSIAVEPKAWRHLSSLPLASEKVPIRKAA